MNPVQFILRKRNGERLEGEEIAQFVADFMQGRVTDYQMSAWLMAVYFQGLDAEETGALTEAMLRSGQVLDLKSVRGPKIDKHSTGGVGDKISLCLAPLVAACGVAVPMISGRGLGHTGGTLDKLESIPGFSVNLDSAEFEQTVRQVGCAMIGQTAELAPADRRIYALRDVTGTVESIPLIVASILSKKLASGIDGLVLDVKVGRGAFMKDRRSAEKLARELVRVATRAGKKAVALLTDMSTPIGRSIGNALETREAIEVLQNRGPADTRELVLSLATEMLRLARPRSARRKLEKELLSRLADGSALERFQRMVEAQGGDPRVTEQPDLLPRAAERFAVKAPRRGYLRDIDAYELGVVAVELGAGRTRADQTVDPAAGIELAVGLGERVVQGAPLAFLHAGSRELPKALAERVQLAFQIGHRPVRPKSRILKAITG